MFKNYTGKQYFRLQTLMGCSKTYFCTSETPPVTLSVDFIRLLIIIPTYSKKKVVNANVELELLTSDLWKCKRNFNITPKIQI